MNSNNMHGKIVSSLIFVYILISCKAEDDQSEVSGKEDDDNGSFGILVVGGTKAKENEFPHMAALGYGNPLKFLCGGSLISDQYVLTAAHCATSNEAGPVRLARLGTIDISEVNDKTQDIPVSQIILHPSYKPPSSYHDIALLKLRNNVKFADNVLPARMQFVSELDPKINQLTTAGWGKDGFLGVQQGQLLKVKLDLTNFTHCQREYQNEKYKTNLPRGVLNDFQVCAGGTVGKDSCQGDSGGPLEYIENNRHIIVGVVSIGKACGLSASPGVYTRVSNYFQWIANQAFTR